jgi:hypothetical protein
MRNYLHLSHSEFVELHNTGKVEIATNKQGAMTVCDSDPRIDRAEKFWHEVRKCGALAMFPIGIVLFFFIPWYWALLFFMLGFPTAKRARDKAAEVVARACLKDAGLYDTCVDAGIVRVFTLP